MAWWQRFMKNNSSNAPASSSSLSSSGLKNDEPWTTTTTPQPDPVPATKPDEVVPVVVVGEPNKASHLVLMGHGLHGGPDDLIYMAQRLVEHYEDSVVALVASCNAGWTLTHDGINTGGERMASEVCAFVKLHYDIHINATSTKDQVASDILESSNIATETETETKTETKTFDETTNTKTTPKARSGRPMLFSIIGHSLGGLYSRFCIGKLYEWGFFNHFTPVNFVTFASPHLGSRRPPRGVINPVVAWFTNTFISTTGLLTTPPFLSFFLSPPLLCPPPSIFLPVSQIVEEFSTISLLSVFLLTKVRNPTHA
eukprot:TRINITY_DN2607_c0_g1_i1.p1 TRINITY_DN2607_c0_g1~~TRINITY_DN2607_c0_g1_i1.p1  ORF type:complete len:313 (-),score=41.12 TRINITY_DN2607_c0_g1_i1:97-1035(-)